MIPIGIYFGELGFGVLGSMACAAAAWAALLGTGNVAWSWATRRVCRIELSAEGFAVYEGREKKPRVFGRRSEMKLQIEAADPAKLGEMRIGDGRSEHRIADLSPRDTARLREVFPKDVG